MGFQLSAFGYQLPRQVDPRRATIVRDSVTLEWVVRTCLASPYVVFDFETSGLAWYLHAEACGIALGFHDGYVHRNIYVPYRHRGEGCNNQLPAATVILAIKTILGNPRNLKIGHNMKFDCHIARRDGIEVEGPMYDTMVGSQIFDENDYVGLKERAVRYLDRDAGYWEERMNEYTMQLVRQHRMGKKKFLDRYGYSLHPVDLCGVYACDDSEFTFGLYCKYEFQEGLSTLYPRVIANEMNLIPALVDMEWNGVLVDVPYLQHIRSVTSAARDRLDEEIRAIVRPYNLNVGSDSELREFCLHVMRLPLTQRTKSETVLAVSYDALVPFAKQFPIIRKILDRREADKLASTYTDSILSRLDSNNILHCDFKQNGTVTGRLASSDPNMQNIASDSDDRAIAATGKKVEDGGIDPWSIKRAFIVPKGYTRFFADYSQIELRVLAYYTRDPIMVDAYMTGQDLHKRAMIEVGLVRRVAKVLNFGLAYGLSAEGLARQAEISLAEAEVAHARFFERYAAIPRYRELFWTRCRLDGNQFRNLWGRPRRVPELSSGDKGERKRAQRKSFGSLIQGTASELTKESLVRLHRWIKQYKLDIKLRLTIHDEIQQDGPTELREYIRHGMKRCMESYPEFDPIPINVDIAESTTTWADKSKDVSV